MTLGHQSDATQIVLELVTDQCRRTVLNHLRTADDYAVHLDEFVGRLSHEETLTNSSLNLSLHEGEG